MAFVSEADRGINAACRSLGAVGPGSYEVGGKRDGGHSCAPFWSTAGRQRAQVEGGPGPGAYANPSAGWAHTITTYSNSSNIIIKLNTLGTPPFQSKQARFPQQPLPAPGPADYSLAAPAHPQRRPRVKSNRLFNAASNAPSIAKVNYLSERRVKTEERTGPPASRKGVLAGVWGRDRSRRFAGKRAGEVGPGSYELPAEPQRERKGAAGSTAFLSGTVRTFDTIVYEAHNADTLALRKFENYRGERPAPGSYNLAPSQTTEPPEYRNHTFGSTGERFGRSKTEEAVPFYDLQRSFQAPSFLKKSVPFNSESKKMGEPVAGSVLPGPGYYTLEQRDHYVARRSVECFGSTAKRSLSLEARGSEQVGPGCYEPLFRRAVELQQSSVFASKLARPCQVSPQPYEVGRGDISEKAREEELRRRNLQRINCAKPPFDRQSPRFRHYEEEEAPRRLTGQQVEFLMRERREEERGRGIEAARRQAQRAGGAIGRGQRFKDCPRAPGVGDYALRSNWTKKSYNIKYSLAQ